MTRYLARARLLALAILIVTSLGFAFTIPVKAQGGIAMSGNFYAQHFELIPGQSVSTPDIYIVVFNNGEQEMRVKLALGAPLGVELILPATDFTLPAGKNRQLEVGVKVGAQVPPGDYDLFLTAEAYREGVGIKLTGAIQQKARLTVTGAAGEVAISTISPQGELFAAIIRLYKQIEGKNLPCGYSETGELKSKLTPGDYLVEAYYQGTKAAQESFSLAVGEKKTITLVPQTIYIEGFAVAREYYTETREMAYAKIAYTINNMYQPLKDAAAVLKVSHEGKMVEETEIISLPILNVGKTAGNQKYIPSGGWQHGTYRFKIELYAQQKLYAQSTEVEISADPAKVVEPAKAGTPAPTTPSAAPAPPATPSILGNWPLIGGAVAAIIIIALLIFLLVRRRAY